MAVNALAEAMRLAEREKTTEILLKDLEWHQGGYPLWRNGLMSAVMKASPKAFRDERDAWLAGFQLLASRRRVHRIGLNRAEPPGPG